MPVVQAVGIAVGHNLSGDPAMAQRMEDAITAAWRHAFSHGVGVGNTPLVLAIRNRVQAAIEAGEDVSTPEAIAAMVDKVIEPGRE